MLHTIMGMGLLVSARSRQGTILEINLKGGEQISAELYPTPILLAMQPLSLVSECLLVRVLVTWNYVWALGR